MWPLKMPTKESTSNACKVALKATLQYFTFTTRTRIGVLLAEIHGVLKTVLKAKPCFFLKYQSNYNSDLDTTLNFTAKRTSFLMTADRMHVGSKERVP